MDKIPHLLLSLDNYLNFAAFIFQKNVKTKVLGTPKKPSIDSTSRKKQGKNPRKQCGFSVI